MELIKNLIRPLRRQFRNFSSIVLFSLHRVRLKQHLKPASQHQIRYLEGQLRRTLLKRDNQLPDRARSLIDKTSELVDLTQCNVLCVGCRNTDELDYFNSKGAKSVTGIDLYSPRQDVLVMDMHSLTFEADQFDLIYSSHSLEHALNPKQVIKEFIRTLVNKGIIVVEVPVEYKIMPCGADLVDFGSLENLHQKFEPYLDQVLWSESHQLQSSGMGTKVVRTIIRVIK